MISITKPSLYELTVLTDIARTSFLESHGHSATLAEIEAYVNSKLNLETLKAELLEERNSFHLVSYQERPVGYSKIILDCPLDKLPAQNITKLERLYLLQDFHGLQLGQALLKHNLQLSREAGQAGTWLYTWVENHRAITFYQKMGFQIVGRYDFKISEQHTNPNHIMWLAY